MFLNSLVKTWSHAKYLCNFYGGELLFIQNKTEQDSIQSNFFNFYIKDI